MSENDEKPRPSPYARFFERALADADAYMRWVTEMVVSADNVTEEELARVRARASLNEADRKAALEADIKALIKARNRLPDAQVKPPDPLPLEVALRAVRDHGTDAYEYLTKQGHPAKRVYAKFESLSERGYLDYGVSPRFPWLTAKGKQAIGEE